MKDKAQEIWFSMVLNLIQNEIPSVKKKKKNASNGVLSLQRLKWKFHCHLLLYIKSLVWLNLERAN